MKTTILSTLICVALLALTGCTTTSTGERVVDIPRVAATIQETTTFGVSELLIRQPNTLIPLTKTLEELNVLESQDAITPGQLLTILNKLPVRQFSGPNGTIVFSGVRMILAASGLSTIEITKLNEFKPIVTAFRQGLINAGVPQ